MQSQSMILVAVGLTIAACFNEYSPLISRFGLMMAAIPFFTHGFALMKNRRNRF